MRMPIIALLLLTVAAAACKKEDAPAKPAPAPEKKPPAPAPAPADAAPPASPRAAYEEIPGFATPESVLVLGELDVYLVSNINGAPTEADDNGFISKLGPDGKIVELKWIDGASDKVKLSAPKGMAARGGKLYVADITAVRVFDLATGEPKGDIDIKGATFLNDVAVAGDKIYVTDSGLDASFKPTGSDAVYEIGADDKVKQLIAGKALGAPNGVTVIDGKIWVVGFGSKALWRVDGGKQADAQDLPAGGMDGIEALGDGRIAVSSWEAKAVWAGKPGEAFTPLIENIESPADFGVDVKRKRVLVPVFQGNTVRFYPY
jgi:hypothetical protein